MQPEKGDTRSGKKNETCKDLMETLNRVITILEKEKAKKRGVNGCGVGVMKLIGGRRYQGLNHKSSPVMPQGCKAWAGQPFVKSGMNHDSF